jgi:hypothetical protein
MEMAIVNNRRWKLILTRLFETLSSVIMLVERRGSNPSGRHAHDKHERHARSNTSDIV